MSVKEFADTMQAGQFVASSERALETLRRRFDQRLACLQAPDAGDRLRSVLSRRARLEGKVSAGKIAYHDEHCTLFSQLSLT